jgi:hypoxanthine phosphoribosyltransferase
VCSRPCIQNGFPAPVAVIAGENLGQVRHEQVESEQPQQHAADCGQIVQARQRRLNLPGSHNSAAGIANFAHPAEADLARLLSFYRVRWLYEPTNFVLRSGSDGRPAESFTPDFYLPDHRLYIELTTMRQSLVTRKNRKLRQLRELFPGVNIKLLYRRDVERLFRSYDGAPQTPHNRHVTVVAESFEIECRIDELADEICADFRLGDQYAHNGGLNVIGIAPGAMTFHQCLASALEERGLSIARDRASVTRFRALAGKQRVRLASAPEFPVAGRDVLLVADVVSTGLSLGYLVGWLRSHGAREVQLCAFFDRSAARLIDLPVRYRAFEAPDEPVVGYGIGARSAQRRLPFVAVLDQPLRRNGSRELTPGHN